LAQIRLTRWRAGGMSADHRVLAAVEGRSETFPPRSLASIRHDTAGTARVGTRNPIRDKKRRRCREQ